MEWHKGKRFAFTIVDDTDESTYENVSQIYAHLRDCGVLTTKTVWPCAPTSSPLTGGETLEDMRYREWVLKLQEEGFEIAFHGATDHSSTRENTLRALARFLDIFGCYPKLYATHSRQAEGMYWGERRLSGARRGIYRTLQRLRGANTLFYGDDPGSEYFWGDICRERITYVRNFTFPEANTLSRDPAAPYHDPCKPYVNFWFSAGIGRDYGSLCELISERSQDRLMEEGGLCIVYAHLGRQPDDGGAAVAEFKRLISRLSKLPGWFAPASEILDHLRAQPGWKPDIEPQVLRRMEWRWLLGKIRVGAD